MKPKQKTKNKTSVAPEVEYNEVSNTRCVQTSGRGRPPTMEPPISYTLMEVAPEEVQVHPPPHLMMTQYPPPIFSPELNSLDIDIWGEMWFLTQIMASQTQKIQYGSMYDY